MSRESTKIKDLFDTLMNSDSVRFPKPREVLDAPTDKGVYVVISPRGAILHVGRTPRGYRGINQRLYNHLNSQSSFARIYLNGKGEVLRQGYKFKYLIVPDDRQRALLEAYATGILCPRHLGTG